MITKGFWVVLESWITVPTYVSVRFQTKSTLSYQRIDTVLFYRTTEPGAQYVIGTEKDTDASIHCDYQTEIFLKANGDILSSFIHWPEAEIFQRSTSQHLSKSQKR